MTKSLHSTWRQLSDLLLDVLARSQDRISAERLTELRTCLAAGEYGVAADLLGYRIEEEGVILTPDAEGALREAKRLMADRTREAG